MFGKHYNIARMYIAFKFQPIKKSRPRPFKQQGRHFKVDCTKDCTIFLYSVLQLYYVRMATHHIILLKRGVNEASREELDFSFQTTLENE